MLIDRSRIREGMTVLSSDGEKLGKVASCDAETFIVEKGLFFPKDYIARYDEIQDVTGDDVRLATTKESFVQLRESGAATSGQATASRMSGEDIRVPVAEEELDVVKRDREAGEVRLRKDVITETKNVDVPVTREQVHVEHVPVSDRREAQPGEKAFEREDVSVPIHEEEVEIRKRPVVKEEVRLRKERLTEQRTADADVRKERVDVEGQEGTRRVESDTSSTGATRRDPTAPYPGPAVPPRDDEDLP